MSLSESEASSSLTLFGLEAAEALHTETQVSTEEQQQVQYDALLTEKLLNPATKSITFQAFTDRCSCLILND
jgi:hypothetical protein